jgi:hypothetical protein
MGYVELQYFEPISPVKVIISAVSPGTVVHVRLNHNTTVERLSNCGVIPLSAYLPKRLI